MNHFEIRITFVNGEGVVKFFYKGQDEEYWTSETEELVDKMLANHDTVKTFCRLMLNDSRQIQSIGKS